MLAALHLDGRISVTDLANKVGLSTSACSRRLSDLQRSGAITGYQAIIDPAVFGLDLETLAWVTLKQGDAATVEDFELALAAIEEVRSAERLFGEPDYLIRIRTRDIDHYQRVRDQRLASLPAIQKITSTIVMRTVVENPPLQP